MSKTRKIPELEFYSAMPACEELYYARIRYKKKEKCVLLDKDFLGVSRAVIIQACFEMGIHPNHIARWTERVYRWYLDHGGQKTR